MTMLIVEYVPYIAFFAAGVLAAWVGTDLLRSRRRKPAVAQESVRGLAGPVQPLTEPEMAPPEELELPVSQAVVPPEAVKPAVQPVAADMMVRRDPSVRVFDTAVAASERKVIAD